MKDSLRPFDIHRDLLPVADLVEQCFAETLDDDGRRFIRQMRSTARSTRMLKWASSAAGRVSMPLSGYVWEKGGKLVGNLSLIPVEVLGERSYLIANVAVHPDHRNRGIARSLTAAALDHIRLRGMQSAWLQVRENNLTAQTLYTDAGFVERTRRTTWRSDPSMPPQQKAAPQDVQINLRRAADWDQQSIWLDQIYPPDVTWNLSYNKKLMRTGFWGMVSRIINDQQIRQWSARREGQLLGVLVWQRSHSRADHLWLAAPPRFEDLAAASLLNHARGILPAHRSLSLNYPAGQAVSAIEGAGFTPQNTLIWMENRFKDSL